MAKKAATKVNPEVEATERVYQWLLNHYGETGGCSEAADARVYLGKAVQRKVPLSIAFAKADPDMQDSFVGRFGRPPDWRDRYDTESAIDALDELVKNDDTSTFSVIFTRAADAETKRLQARLKGASATAYRCTGFKRDTDSGGRAVWSKPKKA